MKFRILAAILAAWPAVAQPVNPVGPGTPTAEPWHYMTPQQGTVMGHMPFQSSSSAIGTTFTTLGVGRTSIVSAEFEGDVVAVQMILYNGTATAWSLQQASISASASYGPPGSTFVAGGTSAYDIQGNIMAGSFVPFTWNNGGTNSALWAPTMLRFTGSSATSGYMVIPLPLNGAHAGGVVTLNFSSTLAGQSLGTKQPGVGMYVRDGRGCIVPGTKTTTVSATQIGIDTAVTATGCLTGQDIWFSYQPIASLGVNVAPTSNSTQGTLVYSDWAMVPSLPRVDGGYTVGMAVSCTGCATGSTVSAVGSSSVTLSSDITSAVANGATVTFSTAQRIASAAVTRQAWVQLASVTSIRAGQTVTGDSVPTGTYVTGVEDSGLVRLNNSLTGNIASGTVLTFSQVAYTNAATSSGAVLPFQSTSGKVLYTIRSAALAGSPTGLNKQARIQDAQRDYGFGYTRASQSTATTDCINVIGNCTNTSGVAGVANISPVYAFRYIVRQRGTTVCTMGDSKMAGGGTSNSGINFSSIAVGAISTQSRPVSFVQTATGGTSGEVFSPQLMQWIQNGTCSVIVAQVNTQNTGNQINTAGYIGLMQQMAQQSGIRTILVADTPRGARNAYQFRVTSAVTNSTIVPINQRFGVGWKNAGGSGYAITGTGIPSGTTFSYVIGDAFLTLSQAATIAKDTMLSLYSGGAITLTTTSGLTAVTLSSNSPITTSGIDLTGNPNIAAGTTITMTQDSTSGTLSANAIGSGTSAATFWQDPSIYIPLAQTGAGLWVKAGTASQPFYDANFCVSDPADPGFTLARYTYDGLHPNDEGHQAIADGVTTAPFPGCRSFTSLLRQVVGN